MSEYKYVLAGSNMVKFGLTYPVQNSRPVQFLNLKGKMIKVIPHDFFFDFQIYERANNPYFGVFKYAQSISTAESQPSQQRKVTGILKRLIEMKISGSC